MVQTRLPWASEVQNVVDGFVGWVPWAQRTTLALPTGTHRLVVEYPGVYLFADFGGVLPEPGASYEDTAIFYVGETGRSLGRRWYDYQRTAWFSQTWGKSTDDVWVAAFPTWIGDDDQTTPEPLTKQFRLYTERRIIWEHISKGRQLLNVR
jgi:hypothetical protein